MSEKPALERADRFFLNSAGGLTIDDSEAAGRVPFGESGTNVQSRANERGGSRNLVARAAAGRVASLARNNPRTAIAAGAAVAAGVAAAVVRSRRKKSDAPKDSRPSKAGTKAKE